MSNEGEGGHEEDEDGGAVLRVAVDLPGHAHESEQPGSLEQTYQRRRLKSGKGRDQDRPRTPGLSQRSHLRKIDLRMTLAGANSGPCSSELLVLTTKEV